ncbi:hypothetical protein ANCCEY_06887 [Ancylostoma ceylanicum]|uniref:SCP domain-containing protein n=1 Tax=Ancylostoma ceylanicum TaxID=53326 RepID=A0A0D6LV98_9BILA|nr:hypothetical protein ANCCEY_06887 [Ancylostoma ceylanicum]
MSASKNSTQLHGDYVFYQSMNKHHLRQQAPLRQQRQQQFPRNQNSLQMGWALSNKLGCSIVKCTTENRYVGVCRYSPRGNTVNSTIYQVGNPCSLNPGNGATTCNTAEGLWS